MRNAKQADNTSRDSIKDITILQPEKGYRFSVDALLLEDFITAKRLHKGVELGAGSGIISILLAKRLKHAKIIAVEIQQALAQCAEENVKINSVGNSVDVLTEDIRNLKKSLSANGFDFVFSNPPFRKPGSGLLSADDGRAAARHEIKITLEDTLSAASYLLKNRGKFYLIYHPFRLSELISLLLKAGLEPKRMRFVHSRTDGEARMVLIEAVKGSGTWLKVEPPFHIYGKGTGYSDEMKKIYGRQS